MLAFVLLMPGVARRAGHLLPGVGPVTSSMAGAGVALPSHALGALAFNTALMAKSEGNEVQGQFILEYSGRICVRTK